MARKGPGFQAARRLLAWYDANARVLPWRAANGVKPDPYRVWLSEIMLQQTTVPAVRSYFEKFTALWPSVEALAAAPLDDVLRAWAGLGYYARARNLHACARQVMLRHGGRFPQTADDLRALPGVGPYTAAAIAAIAFGQRHAAVDGNVERVISRLHAIETPLPAAKPLIREFAQALVPKARAGDFAQAMMDLGATICTPRAPACGQCPFNKVCEGRRKGLASSLPRKLDKKKRPVRHGTAFWIQRDDGAVLLRRRPEKGLLGGMMEIPSTAWGPRSADPEGQAPLQAAWRAISGEVTHTFTHFDLVLVVWLATRITTGELLDDGDYRWVAPASLSEEALPTVMRKIVAHVLGPMARSQTAQQ
jgi:A/G-specific adenine glycosylase